MTTNEDKTKCSQAVVVEAYRLDRYDNPSYSFFPWNPSVVEAYRLDRYDNFHDVLRK